MLRSFSSPISSESMRASCRPRSPTSPTPALSAWVIGSTPRRCAVGRVMTVLSDPVSTTKSCSRAPLTRARTTTLSFTSLNGIVKIFSSRAGLGLERHPLAERAQEADLVARPARLVAGVLVRQQVDVIGVRVGRFFELVRPLVDRSDGVMNLEVAWGESQRGLRLDHRRLELAARRERARHAVEAAGQLRCGRERFLVFHFRLFEQA